MSGGEEFGRSAGRLHVAEHSARNLLAALGAPVDSPAMVDTPRRVARALAELTAGYAEDPADILRTSFDSGYDQMVVIRGVDFVSLCEHHVLPFAGSADVAYIPRGGRVVGLSKIPRLVRCLSRRFQLQERLTEEIAAAVAEHVSPDVGVLVRAVHTCMRYRGVRSEGEMVTSVVRGVFRRPEVRAEFIALARG